MFSLINVTQNISLSPFLQTPEESCILLALPCGRDAEEVRASSDQLKEHFMCYLQGKQAAGIVNTVDDTVCSLIIFMIAEK